MSKIFFLLTLLAFQPGWASTTGGGPDYSDSKEYPISQLLSDTK